MHEPALLQRTPLLAAVQLNCDISDARHAGDYALCTYLLKMREYYRWEHHLPYFRSLSQEDIAQWLSAREERWQALEEQPFLALPLPCGLVDPFDTETINQALLPLDLVYSAGYGILGKPLFFLGSLLACEKRDGFTVLRSSKEHARELAAPPAMALGRTIFAREESARRFVWEKIDEWRWNKQNDAMRRALGGYDFSDEESGLAQMTEDALSAMVLHEMGEGIAGERFGPRWTELVASLATSRAEHIARAIRDHLADCCSTLPALLDRHEKAPLHFYFANFTGWRKQIFPELWTAYRDWAENGQDRPLWLAADQGQKHWQQLGQVVMETYDRNPPEARAMLEALIP